MIYYNSFDELCRKRVIASILNIDLPSIAFKSTNSVYNIRKLQIIEVFNDV
mgnify:CR=1 FL=1